MEKLYNVEHPYSMAEGCFYSRDCRQEFESFDDFMKEWKDADIDMNWVIRWDWEKNDIFKVQFFMQRKGYPFTCQMKIKKSDHDRVLKFLKRHANYMKEVWRPFL